MHLLQAGRGSSGPCCAIAVLHHLMSRTLLARVHYAGQPGEQWTMFFHDPSGNALEFKAMTNPENLFAKYRVD